MTPTVERCAACGEPGHRYGKPPIRYEACINALRVRAEKAERERGESFVPETQNHLGEVVSAHSCPTTFALRMERDSLLRVLEAARGLGGDLYLPMPRHRALLDAIAEHERKDVG